MFKSIKKVWKEMKCGLHHNKYENAMSFYGISKNQYEVMDIVEGVDVILTEHVGDKFMFYQPSIDAICVSPKFFTLFNSAEYDSFIQHELGHRYYGHTAESYSTLEGSIYIECEADKYAVDRGYGFILRDALIKLLALDNRKLDAVGEARFEQLNKLLSYPLI